MSTLFPFSDIDLARRLERAEAVNNADSVETRALLFPESGATWIEVAGTYAMFDGVGSPITQTFGLGMFDPVGPRELSEIERFFKARGAEVYHEVSPMADLSLLNQLAERGYRPIELTSVMYRPLADFKSLDRPVETPVTARQIEEPEREQWAEVSVEGWSEFKEYADLMLDLARISAHRKHAVCFFAELEGRPVATGALGIVDGVALLAGASTIPEARRRGAQRALLDYRLRYAAGHGCSVAMMCALPGSSSQRNAEREGFRIAYTRIKWQLK